MNNGRISFIRAKLPESPVNDCTDLASSSCATSYAMSLSSDSSSLLLDEDMYAFSSSLASVAAVARDRPSSRRDSNDTNSLSGASGGGGLVYFVLFGAICSGGLRGSTCSVALEGPASSRPSLGGESLSLAKVPFGLNALLPTEYGVCGGKESLGGTKSVLCAALSFVCVSSRSSQSCASA